jgi:SAM-dependent methyltransferase
MADSDYLLEPQPYVSDVLKWCTGGTLLDVGAGWGRNARYFAEQGFAVTAVEHNPDLLSRLRAWRSKLGCAIEVHDYDLRQLAFTPRYDVVLCTMVLHFLASKSEVTESVSLLQRATRVGGINVVSLYTSRNATGLRPYLAEPGELAARYRAWSRLDYYEGPGRWHVPRAGGSPRRYYIERITARKPGLALTRPRGECGATRQQRASLGRRICTAAECRDAQTRLALDERSGSPRGANRRSRRP